MKKFGQEPSGNDIVWRALNSLKLHPHDYQNLRFAQIDMANLLRQEGKDATVHLQEAAKYKLLELKEEGYKKVKIVNRNDSLVCDKCRSLEGKEFTIDEALSSLPVPNYCISEDGCRCHYQPVIDLDSYFDD